MQNARDVLTPDSLTMLQVIAEAGSFAAAARQLGLVPSALTYRVRQIEDALDVLLFDRSARQAKPTEAGAELLREGNRLLQEIDAVANRVRRVATGWEPQLTLSVDGVISPHTMLELVEAFYAMSPPTRFKWRDGIMTGTREALTSGRADLAIGVSGLASDVAGLQQALLGDLLFIYVVAPHHPLANVTEPITDAVMLRHRAVAVADSAQRGGITMGLLGGQDVLTVDTMQAKVQAQLRGLGGGFLPEPMVRPYL
jgi:DNA-binding transcriptional LysR family regulator